MGDSEESCGHSGELSSENIKNLIKKERPEFENEIVWVWEKIDKYLLDMDEVQEFDTKEWQEFEDKLQSLYKTVVNLDKDKNLQKKSKKQEPCTKYHYADLFGLEPYYLFVDNTDETMDISSPEKFSNTIITGLKNTKKGLYPKTEIITEEEEMFINEIAILKHEIRERQTYLMAKFDKRVEYDMQTLKFRLKNTLLRFAVFKKNQPWHIRYVNDTAKRLLTVDIKKSLNIHNHTLEDLKKLDTNFLEAPKDQKEPINIPRVKIELKNPSKDDDFNREIFEYASAGRTDIPDAPKLDWINDLCSFTPLESSLPSDIITRMKISEGQEEWEYSAVHPENKEEDEAILEKLVQHFSTVLRESNLNKLFENRDSEITASVDSVTANQFEKNLSSGSISTRINHLLKICPIFNPFYFVPVRDLKTGDIIDYEVKLKNIELREREYNLRGQLNPWIDENNGFLLKKYGWRAPGSQPDDEDEEIIEDEIEALNAKPTEHKKVQKRFEEVNETSITQEIHEILEDIKKKEFKENPKTTPLMKKARESMDKLGIKNIQFPTNDLYDFLNKLDLPHFHGESSVNNKLNHSVKSEQWIENSIEKAFENVEDSIKHVERYKPLTYDVKCLSLFQETMAEIENSPDFEEEVNTEEVNTEQDKITEVDVPPCFDDPKSSGFSQGSLKCNELNEDFTQEWLRMYGSMDELYTIKPEDKEKQVKFTSTIKEYETDHITYPYHSTHVFQPDAVLIRRLIHELPDYSDLAFEIDAPSLEKQEDILNNVEYKEGTGILNEFGKYDVRLLNAFLKISSTESSDKVVNEAKIFFESFDSPEFEDDQDLEIDEFDTSSIELPPNVESFGIDLDPFIFPEDNKKDPLSTFPVDKSYIECEDGSYVQKNNLSKAQILTKYKYLEEEDNTINEYIWAPFETYQNYKDINENKLINLASSFILTQNQLNPNIDNQVENWIKNDIYESGQIEKWIQQSGLKHKHFFDCFDRCSKSEKKETQNDKDENLSYFDQIKRDLEKEQMEEELMMEKTSKLEDQGLQLHKKLEKGKEEKKEEIGRREEQDDSKAIKLGEVSAALLGHSVKHIFNKGGYVLEADTYNPVDMSAVKELAMEHPFKLDNFQKLAILALERDDHVFVAAHTSAGKTVVAEYAIAMARRNQTRVIYTSPVKALSNQKFHDFSQKFEGHISVGLITGDIQLNENAKCLIMTTEILRSMLYNSSEKISDLEFVIFDEVHYLNDPERGHVWEECLILLSSMVKIVMLSATVPNSVEFSNWIGRTKKRKVTVCLTNHRPVPLIHYLYHVHEQSKSKNIEDVSSKIKIADGPLFKNKIDEYSKKCKLKAKEKEAMRKKLAEVKAESVTPYKQNKKPTKSIEASISNDQNASKKRREENVWTNLIYHLKNANLMPVVVFVFSRKMCDDLASFCKVDLTTNSEKNKIKQFLKRHISKLDEDDQKLTQIALMSQLLEKGIAVHHSGILPILKEIVESLFHDGIVKVLFATETFAMGVNMPARTVVFNSIEKFDGASTRSLTPAEYTQMAGRAGRRGKDLDGHVYIMSRQTKINVEELERVIEGSPEELTSQFKVFYRLILMTFAKRDMITIDSMLANSFRQNQQQIKQVYQKTDYDRFVSEVGIYEKLTNDLVSEELKVQYEKFYEMADQHFKIWFHQKEKFIGTSELDIGRYIKICHKYDINKIGIVMDVTRPSRDQVVYVVLTLQSDPTYYESLTPSIKDKFSEKDYERWYKMLSFLPYCQTGPFKKEDTYKLLKIKPADIFEVYQVRERKEEISNIYSFMKRIPSYNEKLIMKLPEYVLVLCRRLFPLTPQKLEKSITINKRMDVDQYELFAQLKSTKDAALQISSKFPLNKLPIGFEEFFIWKESIRKMRAALKDLEEHKSRQLYQNKINVLKEKDYINENEDVQKKGYIASRISKYELIVTEMLINNVVGELEPPEVAALFSFLVYQGRCRKGDSEENTNLGDLSPRLFNAVILTQQIIQDIKETETRNGIDQDSCTDIERLDFGITRIIFSWASQMKFTDILKLPEACEFQEGILVRLIQQLLETLKEIESAAKVMGDSTVLDKIRAASQLIRRGIVFAPSLYTKGFQKE